MGKVLEFRKYPVRYVLLARFCEISGYTQRAVYRKMQTGVWVQGVHYIKSPDGHIHIDLEVYELWLKHQSILELKSAAAA